MSELEDIARGTGQAAREARRTLKRRAAATGTIGDFSPLVDRLDDLAARIAPGERKLMGRDIAKDLRAANGGRIFRNVQPPDDEPMTPRKVSQSKKPRPAGIKAKPASGEKRRKTGRMFRKAGQATYLRTESSTGQAQVGYVGAMARIMAVHQYGQEDTVTRDPDSPKVRYAERIVLGFTVDDRRRILDRVVAQAAP